jgi:hypothetical protein
MTVKKVPDAGLVACSLEQRQLPERMQRWQALAARAALDIAANERGLRLILRAEAGVEEALDELVALERECCAFADWSVRPTGAEIVLETTGASEESVAAVQAMFGNLRNLANR